MKTLVRSSLSSALYWGGRWLGQNPSGTRILCYHRVNDGEKKYDSVTLSRFREQMDFLAQAGYRTVSLGRFFDEPGDEKNVVITFDDGYRDNLKNAFPILEEFGFRATVFCVGSRIGEEGYLTRPDLRQMQEGGWEIGSHTLSHPDLRSLDIGLKWREIAESKSFLEEFLDLEIDFFCYPFGFYDEESVALVQKAGYRGACTNRPGANPDAKDPYLLRRTEIGAGDTPHDFKKKMAGAYDLLHRALHSVRGRP